MQPFLTPDVPPLMAYGFLLAFAGIGAYCFGTQLQVPARMLGAMCIALLCAGRTVYASQPVLNPCSAIDQNSWLWILSGCFLGMWP